VTSKQDNLLPGRLRPSQGVLGDKETLSFIQSDISSVKGDFGKTVLIRRIY